MKKRMIFLNNLCHVIIGLIKLKKQGTNVKSFSLVGGVANNNYIKLKLTSY